MKGEGPFWVVVALCLVSGLLMYHAWTRDNEWLIVGAAVATVVGTFVLAIWDLKRDR